MELSLLVFLPVAAAVVILLLPRRMEQHARWIALGGSVAILAISLQMFFTFDLDAPGYQFVERREWVDVGAFNLQYFLGVDGLSMPLIVLTTVLTLASVLVSFSVTLRPRAYYACLMVLPSSVIGVSAASGSTPAGQLPIVSQSMTLTAAARPSRKQMSAVSAG